MADVANLATVSYISNSGNFSNTGNRINACNFNYDVMRIVSVK